VDAQVGPRGIRGSDQLSTLNDGIEFHGCFLQNAYRIPQFSAEGIIIKASRPVFRWEHRNLGVV
jgi:hypothetical protein